MRRTQLVAALLVCAVISFPRVGSAQCLYEDSGGNQNTAIGCGALRPASPVAGGAARPVAPPVAAVTLRIGGAAFCADPTRGRLITAQTRSAATNWVRRMCVLLRDVRRPSMSGDDVVVL